MLAQDFYVTGIDALYFCGDLHSVNIFCVAAKKLSFLSGVPIVLLCFAENGIYVPQVKMEMWLWGQSKIAKKKKNWMIKLALCRLKNRDTKTDFKVKLTVRKKTYILRNTIVSIIVLIFRQYSFYNKSNVKKTKTTKYCIIIWRQYWAILRDLLFLLDY